MTLLDTEPLDGEDYTNGVLGYITLVRVFSVQFTALGLANSVPGDRYLLCQRRFHRESEYASNPQSIVLITNLLTLADPSVKNLTALAD